MTSRNPTRFSTRMLAALLVACLVPLGVVLAAPPPCIKRGDLTCEPAKLCSFAFQLANDQTMLQLFRANQSPSSPLHKKALELSKRPLPDGGVVSEGAAFDQLVSEEARAKLSKLKRCGLLNNIEPDKSILPDWDSFYTSEDCYQYSQHDNTTEVLSEFKDKSGACPEFVAVAAGHEDMHTAECNRDRTPARHTLSHHIPEDIEAYKYSVAKGTENVRRLALRCTTDPDKASRQLRAKTVIKYLSILDDKKGK
jgi:hypothetical protein